MGGQSPAKLLRSVKRMTKFLEAKENLSHLKPILTTVVLPGINILPVLPTLSIANVQSTTILSETQDLPSTDQTQPTNDAPYQHFGEHQALPAEKIEKAANKADNADKAATSKEIDDILTQGQFFEIMNNFQKELLKPF